MSQNPFPGPQPFRATDRAHFHGREDLSRRLEGAILVHRAVVVHGPSGSGKSSLIQASVLPNLRDAEDVRVVQLDGWPPGEDPTHWLSIAMHSELKQGSPSPDSSPPEAVLNSLKRAVRGSSRILVICIDQLEQLFYPGRDTKQTERFFDCVNDILDLPLRTLRVVMSLREDYLGVFRDRLRDHRRVLGQGFRVGPLSVAELTDSVCQTATTGVPPQAWSPGDMRALMMQVRVPGQPEADDAEAQSAYGQIVCRALFQERAAGQASTNEVAQAEPILQRYLETTLADLGALRERADRLLEDHLVSGDGGRTLRTEKELQRFFSPADLQTILTALEGAAILHAASHQGTRYFEIGHDWLARKVFEKRQIREREEERIRREEEQARALEKARRERRVLFFITIASLVGVAGATAGALWAAAEKKKAERAEEAANRAALVAKRSEIDARDASILSGVRELSSRGKLTWAMKLLPEVALPAKRRGWVALASDLLAGNALRSTLEGHTASLTTASFSPDGKRILTTAIDGTARIWDYEGETAPIVLSEHADSITIARWSHDGKYFLTASRDGTARIYEASGKGTPVVLEGAKGPLTYADFSPDDTRVVTASRDGFVRIHPARGNMPPVEIEASKAAVYCAIFHPDGKRVFFSSHDGFVQSWDGKPRTKPVKIGKHEAAVTFLALSPDKVHLASASIDGTAHIWNIDLAKPRIVATIVHDGPVNHLAFSRDAHYVATASADHRAKVLRIGSGDPPIVLSGHKQSITQVAFHPNGKFIATASLDMTARIFRIRGGASFTLRGHEAAVRTIAWSPDASAIVTAAGDGTARSADETAKIWSTRAIEQIAYGVHGPFTFHQADIAVDEMAIVTAHDDDTARVFRREDGDDFIPLTGHSGWVHHASFAPDSKSVTTASFDKSVRVFRLDKPSNPITLGQHEAEARFALFSPDATRVLSGGDDSKAMIFAVDGKSAPITLAGHRDWLVAGAWSPDGKRVVTASFDHTARIWNADGTGIAEELVGHKAEVVAAAFFPDGKRVVTASADHTARIWQSGQTSRQLLHGGPVSLIAVSFDGKFVATYSGDLLIRIWRADSDEQPIEFEANAPLRVLKFDKDRRIITLDVDNAMHTWMIDVDKLRERIVRANADCLPAAIRMLYLHEVATVADERYASCKKNPYQMPWYLPVDQAVLAVDVNDVAYSLHAPTLEVYAATELGRDLVRVKVVVIPSDAAVEVDGVSVPRKHGVVVFVAKVGQVRKLHVQRGAKHRSFDIKILGDRADPARIDLNDKPAATVTPSSTNQTRKEPANSLLPEEMQ